MPNIVTVALALAGTTEALDALRRDLLVADGESWTLACAEPVRTIHHAAKLTSFDRTDAAWDAAWVDRTPGAAVLSFLAAWTPSARVLNGVGALAAQHGVAVTRVAAIEETLAALASNGHFACSLPATWAGQGLQIHPVPAHSEADERLLAACAHRPTSRRTAARLAA